jgi:hypothetical protein
LTLAGRFAVLWVTGLLTLVPYCVYYLLYEAPREQYALFITLPLFWIFGYWGVAGPLIAAVRVRQVFRLLEQVRTREQLVELWNRPETREAAVDAIARENRLPRFLARRVLALMERRLSRR